MDGWTLGWPEGSVEGCCEGCNAPVEGDKKRRKRMESSYVREGCERGMRWCI